MHDGHIHAQRWTQIWLLQQSMTYIGTRLSCAVQLMHIDWMGPWLYRSCDGDGIGSGKLLSINMGNTWLYAYYLAICLLHDNMHITWQYAYYMAMCIFHGHMPTTWHYAYYTPGQRPNAVHTWPEAECRVPGLARGRMPDAEPPSQRYYNEMKEN